MAVDSLDPVGVYFGTRSGKLFGSSDEGKSWEELVDVLPPVVSVKAARNWSTSLPHSDRPWGSSYLWHCGDVVGRLSTASRQRLEATLVVRVEGMVCKSARYKSVLLRELVNRHV